MGISLIRSSLEVSADMTNTIEREIRELAARLGSPVTFDRNGEVVFYENFNEVGIGGWGQTLSAGVALLQSNDIARSRPTSLKIAIDNVINHYAILSRNFAVLSANKLGFEVSICLPFTGIAFELNPAYQMGKNAYSGSIIYRNDGATDLLQYEDSVGVYRTLDTTLRLNAGAGMFHTFKLIIDVAQGYYDHLLLDDMSYDLSSELLYKGVSVGSGFGKVVIEVVNETANAVKVYLDDIIVTRNEP